MTEKEIFLAAITGLAANPEYTHFDENSIVNAAISITEKVTSQLNKDGSLRIKKKDSARG